VRLSIEWRKNKFAILNNLFSPQNLKTGLGNSVSNPGFPEPETRVFSTTKPGYFKKPGIVAFKY